MRILMISDIFGLTTQLHAFAESFSGRHQVEIFSPYCDLPPPFQSDTDAYDYFLAKGGHERYQKQLQNFLKKNQGFELIIAFSAGASAIWHVSARMALTTVRQIISFYPSQIRNQLALTANVATHLIFPVSEPHFSVDKILTELAGRKGISYEKTDFLHGFMNPLSTHFDRQAYHYFCQRIMAEHSL